MTAHRLTAEQTAEALADAECIERTTDEERGPMPAGDARMLALALLDATAERDRLVALLAPVREAARAYAAPGVTLGPAPVLAAALATIDAPPQALGGPNP